MQSKFNELYQNMLDGDIERYLLKLMRMDYKNCCKFLREHYGPVPGDFFVDELDYKKNEAISREDEGLEVHHVDEDKCFSLSKESYARMFPYKYQEAGRLIYCNRLEHMILHIKIIEVKLHDDNSGLRDSYDMCCFIVTEIYLAFREYYLNEMVHAKTMIKPRESSFSESLKYLIEIFYTKGLSFSNKGESVLNSKWGNNSLLIKSPNLPNNIFEDHDEVFECYKDAKMIPMNLKHYLIIFAALKVGIVYLKYAILKFDFSKMIDVFDILVSELLEDEEEEKLLVPPIKPDGSKSIIKINHRLYDIQVINEDVFFKAIEDWVDGFVAKVIKEHKI